VQIDYNALATEYALHRQVQPKVLEDLILTGNLDPTSRVLDVGCGTGNYAVALNQAVGCSTWGIEPAAQMLAKASARSQSIQFKLGSAEVLDYADEIFDLVFSVDVIHHVNDRAKYFCESYRVLKQGGKVCTVTDSEEIIRHRQPLSDYFPETVDLELQRYPYIFDLREMMARAGFHSLEEIKVEFAYPLTDIQIYRDKAFSCLHLIPAQAFERGIQRMEEDLQGGSIMCVSRYMLLWGAK
jgi:SAM-dependent methyltransferase